MYQIDVLEYIHNKTYIHGDIKGGNLLLDLKTNNSVYLVDFGLASHYTTKTEYKLDPKKSHDGTIEYTSRDAHMGGEFVLIIFVFFVTEKTFSHEFYSQLSLQCQR